MHSPIKSISVDRELLYQKRRQGEKQIKPTSQILQMVFITKYLKLQELKLKRNVYVSYLLLTTIVINLLIKIKLQIGLHLTCKDCPLICNHAAILWPPSPLLNQFRRGSLGYSQVYNSRVLSNIKIPLQAKYALSNFKILPFPVPKKHSHF